MHQRQTQSSEPPEFPGCKPVPLPRAAIERFEGRLEYWDATTEIAWICEPTTSYHERPARLLTRLAEVIARVRGSHVECYGSMDLLLRDARGEPYRIMQADESLYLHPAHARLPGAAMVVGEDDFPDVVLEVDHTTDARRGKLPLYESWGFPEVWVDVPDAPSPSRPRARRPGLTIHPLEDGRDRVAAESPAFPGWTAAEIHEALNGAAPSARTSVVLERVGGVQGAREGTGPDDDPLLRSQRRQGFERGHAEGHAEGLIEGVRNARAEMVRHILVSRGIEVSAGVLADAAFAAAPGDVLIAAALACEDEAAFRAAISRSHRLRPRRQGGRPFKVVHPRPGPGTALVHHRSRHTTRQMRATRPERRAPSPRGQLPPSHPCPAPQADGPAPRSASEWATQGRRGAGYRRRDFTVRRITAMRRGAPDPGDQASIGAGTCTHYKPLIIYPE